MRHTRCCDKAKFSQSNQAIFGIGQLQKSWRKTEGHIGSDSFPSESSQSPSTCRLRSSSARSSTMGYSYSSRQNSIRAHTGQHYLYILILWSRENRVKFPQPLKLGGRIQDTS